MIKRSIPGLKLLTVQKGNNPSNVIKTRRILALKMCERLQPSRQENGVPTTRRRLPEKPHLCQAWRTGGVLLADQEG